MSAVLELLLADARTPTGGHAHSGGLEAALAAGLALEDVPAFMRARLGTIGRVEAAIAACASRAGTVDELLALDLELAARMPAEPLRRASGMLGAGLVRTAGGWWPSAEPLTSYRAASRLTLRPVALGAVTKAAALAPVAAARLSLYDDAATVASAAVKLAALDAAVASGWLVSLAGEIDELAAVASGDRLRLSTSTPLLDRRAVAHAVAERRLFVS